MIQRIIKMIDAQTKAAEETQRYLRLGRIVSYVFLIGGGVIVIYGTAKDAWAKKKQEVNEEEGPRDWPGDDVARGDDGKRHLEALVGLRDSTDRYPTTLDRAAIDWAIRRIAYDTERYRSAPSAELPADILIDLVKDHWNELTNRGEHVKKGMLRDWIKAR